MKTSLFTFLSIDMGASSGRVVAIQFNLKDKSSKLDVIHRFNHSTIGKNGYECWDLEYIKQQIFKGLFLASHLNPISLAVDTWAADYVLKKEDGSILMPAVSLRDKRTNDIVDIFHEENNFSVKQCFDRTGIQPHQFNTLYQLYAVKKKHPDILKQTYRISLFADYITSLLCDYDGCEYSNASSTQMINYKTKSWDTDILNMLGIKQTQWGNLEEAACIASNIKSSMAKKTALSSDTLVTITTSHDTASAVIGSFLDEKTAFLNLGTWALLGCISEQGFFSESDLYDGWSNEALSKKYYRPIKNIMGQWIISKFKKDINDNRPFEEIDKKIEHIEGYKHFIDVNNSIFFNPLNMKNAIDTYLEATKQSIPKNIDDYYRLIYENLVLCYDYYISKLSNKKTIEKLHIVGGGTNDRFSIPLLAKLTGLQICIGSPEATSIGNIYNQIKALNLVDKLSPYLDVFTPSFHLHYPDNSAYNGIKQNYKDNLDKYRSIHL